MAVLGFLWVSPKGEVDGSEGFQRCRSVMEAVLGSQSSGPKVLVSGSFVF